MKEEARAKTGRKPKSDPADYKYSFRLNAGENTRFEKLVTASEAKDKTRFIKKAIFGGTIKVVKIDKAKLEKMTLELMLLTKKTIALTEEYQKKWLQK